jgi:excisionase family DNA binding protein
MDRNTGRDERQGDRLGAVGQLLSRQQAADLLAVPPKTLARWASLGQGPAYFKVGRHARYRQADLEAWLAARRHEPTERS